jgi:hypothetical protein
MEGRVATGHLTDEELFGLALPPAGEPEALPSHVLQCPRCGQALQDWKAAVRDLGREEVEPMLRRTPAEWRAAEDRTIERLRREGSRRPRRALPWAVGLAAAVLLAVLLSPWIRSVAKERATPAAPDATSASELSGADAADDRLLRDVARLSRGDDAGAMGGLVPDPTAETEEKL